MRWRVNAIGDTCPLHGIACCFQISWITAGNIRVGQRWLIGIARLIAYLAIYLSIIGDTVAIGGSSNVSHATT